MDALSEHVEQLQAENKQLKSDLAAIQATSSG